MRHVGSVLFMGWLLAALPAWGINSYSPWLNQDEVNACRKDKACVYPLPGGVGTWGYCARIDPKDGWRHKIWRLNGQTQVQPSIAACIAQEWPPNDQ